MQNHHKVFESSYRIKKKFFYSEKKWGGGGGGGMTPPASLGFVGPGLVGASYVASLQYALASKTE